MSADPNSRNVVRNDFHDGIPAQLTGMRGHTLAAAAVMHKAAFRGLRSEIDGLEVEETYDLVVAGAGLSGLAAAYFYRKRFGGNAKILIVDPLDDFGGHATRNSFSVDGKELIGYGGSESFQSPATNFSPVVHGLLRELGVDLASFRSTHFQHRLYADLGLTRGTFFGTSRFGRDTLVTGDPTAWVSDEVLPEHLKARTLAAYLADFPLPENSRDQLFELYTSLRVTLDHLRTPHERAAYLSRKSYLDFLAQDWQLADDAIAYFRHRTLDFFGLPAAHVTALDALHYGYPGAQGVELPRDHGPGEGPLDEPYVYHFPDGNASLARMLVRELIPTVAPGRGMDDIVHALFDYSQLDRPENGIRIRLGWSVSFARNAGDGTVDLGLSRGEVVRRIRAKHVTLACFNMAIPYILRDLPEDQAKALAQNVKAPLVYTTVAVRNWHPWVKLGVHEIFGVDTFHVRAKLDYPVDLGGYACAKDPAEPILLHLVHVPCVEDPALDPRAALRKARGSLMKMEFAAVEAEIRSDLTRMLGPGGFDAERDIAAITVNRWSHGYSYGQNGLCESVEEANLVRECARRRVGNVTIAGADAAWNAYAHSAIDEAMRAVLEFA